MDPRWLRFSRIASALSRQPRGTLPGSAAGSGGLFHPGTTATLYQLPGPLGWTASFRGRPNPSTLVLVDRFGPSPSGFGFVIFGATKMPVVVEAGADLTALGWTPISTNTLKDGWVRFTDPGWMIEPARFYRVRGQ